MTHIMGLCRGRHVMPEEVQEFIFDTEVNPVDFDGMYKHVAECLFDKLHCKIHAQPTGLHQEDYTDVCGWQGDELVLYVTGLTAAAMAVVRFCAFYGCHLKLMHYDRESGAYVAQRMW